MSADRIAAEIHTLHASQGLLAILQWLRNEMAVQNHAAPLLIEQFNESAAKLALGAAQGHETLFSKIVQAAKLS